MKRVLLLLWSCSLVACGADGDGGSGGLHDGGPDGGRASTDGGSGNDAGAGCSSMTVCGSPPACCPVSNECVDGRCLPSCASGVRCGADHSVCCGAAQVCLGDACVDPTGHCVDSFDCPIGSFCEPTLAACLPQLDPVTCRRTPVFGELAVRTEWSAVAATDRPTCVHPISAPLVVDLDGDGAPEVVSAMACSGDWTRAVLRALDGRTGAVVWSAHDELNGRASIAAADLDADGHLEIVGNGAGTDGRMLAFAYDGTLLWQSTQRDGSPLSLPLANGAPTLANLDGEGGPEIIVGAVVLSSDGVVRWTGTDGVNAGSVSRYAGGISAVADIDLDGRPEVVAGKRAYEHDGTVKWTAPVAGDGYPGVANFDGDPQPEVVLVHDGFVSYVDGVTGAVEWGPVAIPGGGLGGPPTIADFDGDHLPEIGVAGARSYSVYDPDGARDVLWSRTTQDLSSNATGSSVFDFEGDGIAEVVYGDECYVRVYRGTDGMVLLTIPNSTATIHEYPIVVDVDADGNSEIVVVANDWGLTPSTCPDAGYPGGRHGVFVYGDARDQWMRTRRVWNQHAYHVTNVSQEGVVPIVETNNWSLSGLNNYRQNVQGEGAYNAPDLRIQGLAVQFDGCPGSARVTATIANVGSLGVPAGVAVAFWRGTAAAPGALLGVAHTTMPLLPGQSERVEQRVMLEGDPPYSFVAKVDDDGTGVGAVDECDEAQNAETISDVSCAIVI